MPDEPEPKHEDIVILHSPTEDGEGARVLRAREGRVEAGEVRPMKEGKPIAGEVVTLKPREGQPWLCDVKVDYAPPPKAATHKPAQVATHAYRESWERTFGARSAPGGDSGAAN